jgi:hypothetical protein
MEESVASPEQVAPEVISIRLSPTEQRYVAECSRRTQDALTEARVWEESLRTFLAVVGAAVDPEASWDLQGGSLVKHKT